jgi:glycosyltransferase involved in cell wall biosynthesis
MSDIPLVSVVIPNYNYEKFLPRRIESILAQTFRDFEIIFLDDASTDGSIELVRQRYSDRIQHIDCNTTNSGNPFSQWNRGVSLARGKYVWIAEADDDCDEAILSALVSIIQSTPNVVLAYCRSIPVDANGDKFDPDFLFSYVNDLHADRWRANFVNDGDDEIVRFLSKKNTIVNVSSVLFDKDAYVASGFAPENFRMCGDWLTYCKLAQLGRVAYCSAPHNYHRQHQSRHTQNSVLNLTYFREFLEVHRWVFENVKASGSSKQELFGRFIKEWARLTVSEYGVLSARKQLALALMTKRVYNAPTELTAILRQYAIGTFRALVKH